MVYHSGISTQYASYTFVCLYTLDCILFQCILVCCILLYTGRSLCLVAHVYYLYYKKKLKRGIYQKISPAGVLEKRFIEFCPTRINLSTNVVVVFMGDNNDLNLIRRGCMIFDLLSKPPVVFKILQTIQIVKPTLFHRWMLQTKLVENLLLFSVYA